MKWEFTPAETLFAWEQLGWDRIPAPLAVRPDVSSLDEWARIENDLRERFPVLDDPDLVPVLRTAADPEMSVMMIGARKHPLRAYGAVTANVGVTMVQRPGPEADTGGNVVIEVGAPQRVSQVFAAVAGDRPAGRVRNLVETWERVQDERPAVGFVSDQPETADRIRELLTEPRTGDGHIEIRLDRHEPRQRSPRYISWFDVDGDGRYTYTRRYGDFHIDPCGSDDFRRMIARLMEL